MTKDHLKPFQMVCDERPPKIPDVVHDERPPVGWWGGGKFMMKNHLKNPELALIIILLGGSSEFPLPAHTLCVCVCESEYGVCVCVCVFEYGVCVCVCVCMV